MLNKEGIKKALEEAFKKQDKKENRIMELHPFGWLHHTWEEDGQQYSSWSFYNNGVCQITTGDKGKEEFDNIFKQKAEKSMFEYIKNSPKTGGGLYEKLKKSPLSLQYKEGSLTKEKLIEIFNDLFKMKNK